MKLWCSQCHTCWTEAVLELGRKCPFKDCGGYLSMTEPAKPTKPTKPTKPEFPLLEKL